MKGKRRGSNPVLVSLLWLLLPTTCMAASVLAAPTAAAPQLGVRLQFEVRDLRDQEAPLTTTSILIAGERLRMDGAFLAGQVATSLIFDAQADEIWCLDHRQQRYLVLDRETVEGMAGILRETMEELQAALEDVPEEQREVVRAMAEKRLPKDQLEPKISSHWAVEEEAEQATKAGYPSRRYRLLHEGRELRQLWLTEWHNLEGGEEIAKVLDAAGLLLRQLVESGEEELLDLGAAELLAANLLVGITDLGGFPVESTELIKGKAIRRATLKSIERHRAAPALFALPPGYLRQEPGKGVSW